jgi:hypothetical protein
LFSAEPGHWKANFCSKYFSLHFGTVLLRSSIIFGTSQVCHHHFSIAGISDAYACYADPDFCAITATQLVLGLGIIIQPFWL